MLLRLTDVSGNSVAGTVTTFHWNDDAMLRVEVDKKTGARPPFPILSLR